MNRLLIIEDDPDIALSLRYSFEKEGDFVVRVSAGGEDGLREAERQPPDLLLLDLNLPRIDGNEVCRLLRANPATRNVPVIMLTARVEQSDVLRGLATGADDYVTKPFSVVEVVARARALLRRSRGPLETVRLLGDERLSLDESTRTVRVSGAEVALTRKEFDLLAYLMRSAGRVASRDQLLERVWGYEHHGSTRTVDVHIRQLRRKLGAQAAERIETVVGIGYRLREPA